jgi:hypothetical protein
MKRIISIISIGLITTFLLSGCTGQVNISEINNLSKQDIKDKLHISYDEYRDITFITPYQDFMTGMIFRNPYIELQNDKKFLHVQHVGKDWIFIKEVNILADGERFKFQGFKKYKRNVDVVGAGVKSVYVNENVYIPISDNDIQKLEKIRKSTDTKML